MSQAQRVGPISAYEPSEDGRKPARFKVDGYAVKCWPTIVTEWNDKTPVSREPHPVIEKIEGMTARDMAKLWLVGGVEEANTWTTKEGERRTTRQFMADMIAEATPDAQSVFTMDKDGNPLLGADAAASSQALRAPQTPDLFSLAVEPVIQAMDPGVGTFSDEHGAQIVANYRFLVSLRADLPNSSPPSSANGEVSEEIVNAFE